MENTWSPIPRPSSSPLRRNSASNCSRIKRRQNSPLKSLTQVKEGLSRICLTSKIRLCPFLLKTSALSGPLLSPMKYLQLLVSQFVCKFTLFTNFQMHVVYALLQHRCIRLMHLLSLFCHFLKEPVQALGTAALKQWCPNLSKETPPFSKSAFRFR